MYLVIRTPVAGNVSRFDAAGLRKRYPLRHSAVPVRSIPVGDERCCSAGVFCVAVRPYHPTPPTTALAEGAGASRVQACRPCLQVSAADSAIVPLRGIMPAGRL